MSLEDAIKENTLAIRALIAALPGSVPQPAEPPKSPAKTEAKVEKPAKVEKAAEPVVASKEPPAAAVEYTDVRAAVNAAVARVTTTPVVELIRSFDCATAKDLKPEQWAEFITKCNALEVK